MWRYLGLVSLFHAVWTAGFLVLFTLTVPLDRPWWEAGPWAAPLVLGLSAQMCVLPVLGLLVMLWPDRGLGLGFRASALRVMDLAGGREFRRRWPLTVSGALLVLLGFAGGGALGLVLMFTSFFWLVDPVDRELCPEGA